MTFAEKLKVQRGVLTQRDAADAIGIPIATYRNWEGGLFDPPRARQKTALAHLAETAGTPLLETWNGTTTPEEAERYVAEELSGFMRVGITTEVFFPPGVQARVAERLGKRCPNQTTSHETADYVAALWRERNQASEERVEEIDLELERIALLVDGPLLEPYNVDGSGEEEHAVYRVPVISPDCYWDSVGNIPCPCPIPGCGQWVCWYEAGYVPGYRVCMAAIPRGGYAVDSIKHRFMASGTATDPKLILL